MLRLGLIFVLIFRVIRRGSRRLSKDRLPFRGLGDLRAEDTHARNLRVREHVPWNPHTGNAFESVRLVLRLRVNSLALEILQGNKGERRHRVQFDNTATGRPRCAVALGAVVDYCTLQHADGVESRWAMSPNLLFKPAGRTCQTKCDSSTLGPQPQSRPGNFTTSLDMDMERRLVTLHGEEAVIGHDQRLLACPLVSDGGFTDSALCTPAENRFLVSLHSIHATLPLIQERITVFFLLCRTPPAQTVQQHSLT